MAAAVAIAMPAAFGAARAAAQAGEGTDPLGDQMSRCEYWYQSPGQPGRRGRGL